MTKYPNSICDAHQDVETSEPVCIACLLVKLDELQKERNGLIELLLKVSRFATEHGQYLKNHKEWLEMLREIIEMAE